MKTILVHIIAVIAMLMTQSCVVHSSSKDFGPKKSLNIAVTDFDEVSLSGGLNIVYVEGATPKVTVSGPQKLLGDVEVVQKGRKITVKSKPRANNGRVLGKNPNELLTITIQSRCLRGIQLSGACELKAKQIRSEADFYLSATGAGELELGTLQCAKAVMTTSGAADIDISNLRCDHLSWSSSGASDISLKNVESHTFTAILSGASELDATLSGVDNTNIRATGASDVDLKFNRCGSAELSAHGASEFDLSGTLRSLTKDVSTGSSIDDKELRTGR